MEMAGAAGAVTLNAQNLVISATVPEIGQTVTATCAIANILVTVPIK